MEKKERGREGRRKGGREGRKEGRRKGGKERGKERERRGRGNILITSSLHALSLEEVSFLCLA